MGRSKVSIVKGSIKPCEEEIATLVRKAIELAGGLPDKIGTGDKVLIKPNVAFPRPPEDAVTTDPRICKAIAEVVIEKGAIPVIAESSAVGIDTEEAFARAGYTKLREEGYRLIDLKRKGIKLVRVAVPRGKSLKEVMLPRIVLEAKAIISVPKMKTHDQPLVTLSLKNMKGLLPDVIKRKFHTTFGVFQACADLATTIKPDLSVVDGITAMEGLGPVSGDLVEMDLVIAGKDPVAVDAVTCAVMGFGLREDPIVDAAVGLRAGVADLKKIEIVGESIAKVRRRFKRCSDALHESAPFPEDFELLMGERTCSACRNTVFLLLYNLKKENRLGDLNGFRIVAGKVDNPPVIDARKLVIVGACAATLKDVGIFVGGCPPNGSYITEAIGIRPVSGVSRPEAV